MKKLTLLATLSILSACGSKPEEQAAADPVAAPATETVAANGAPAAFAQCATCHSVEKDAPNGVGPNLHGVVGRKAAQALGFNYSPSMKDWGQTWTEANLDKYIENPRAIVAGTRMSFAGQKDAAKRKEIIDWLKKNG